MSVVEDVRKTLQDVLAPDLKALDAKLTAVEASVKDGFAAAERVAAARHELILAELRTAKAISDARYEAVLKGLEIDKRLEKVEAKQTQAAAVGGGGRIGDPGF
jgi:Xaa-Pro aminopeptidase